MPVSLALLLRRRLLVLALLLSVGLVAAGPSGASPARALASGPDPVGTWPLVPEPAVVAHFDPPDSAYGPGHRGVDLAGRPGQVVRSALPGRVDFVGSIAGRGVVVVDPGATRTTYEPVAATVGLGVTVGSGTPVGTLQLPGSHCFPRACLHWGWIEGETYLDPLRLVGGGPVRLLPLWRVEPVVSRGAAPLAPLLVPLSGWPLLLPLLRPWTGS